MEHLLTPQLRNSRTRTSLRLAAVAAVAAVGLATATSASAYPSGSASLDYTTWAVNVPPFAWQAADCTVFVGPVKDPVYAFPNYRKIAGVQVGCNTPKSSIAAWVQLEKYENGRAVVKGAVGYGYLANTFGSGTIKKGSQPFCGGRGAHWRTVAWVRLSGGTTYGPMPSPWVKDSYGC